jgi:cardiolipin synthase
MNQSIKELFYLPNLISLCRLILSFIIPILWVNQTSSDIIYALIVFGALSDTLDGNLARLLNQRSNLGKILDPLADKCFINMLFFLFYYENVIPLSFLMVILVRDLLILIGALYLIFLTKGKAIPSPSILGKATTVVQLITLMLLFMHYFLYSLPELFLSLVINITILLTLTSGLHYILSFRRMLSHA